MKYIMLFERFLINEDIEAKEPEVKTVEKSVDKFPETLSNKFTKNNGYQIKFVGDNNSDDDKFSKYVKENDGQKLGVLYAMRQGKDAYFKLTVNKKYREEAYKIVESLMSSLPDGYRLSEQGDSMIEIHPPK